MIDASHSLPHEYIAALQNHLAGSGESALNRAYELGRKALTDGFSQALLEDYADKLDGEGRQYLQFVRESAQQMAQLIDDLLKLSRVSRSELRLEPVDLSGLVRTVLAQLQSTTPDRQVELVVQ